MHLLYRRYSRSGAAPPAFYAVAALGFVALAVWGAVTRDWPIVGIAIAMVLVTAAGSRVMRRLEAPRPQQPPDTTVDEVEDG